MAITKTVQIDGKDVTFRASAAIPRMYRIRFRRDIYQDMAQLTKEVDANDPNKSEIELDNLEMFENIAYLMAKHADPDSVPKVFKASGKGFLSTDGGLKLDEEPITAMLRQKIKEKGLAQFYAEVEIIVRPAIPTGMTVEVEE